VIAAYNCGPGNMKKAIARSGGKKNYWDVFYYLPRETRGFVPAFIAATYIMNYSQDHGFYAVKPQIPINADTVMVYKELHLGQVSEVLGVDVGTLQVLNPKYRRKILPQAGGPHDLRLPEDKVSSFIAYQDSILGYKQHVYLAKHNMDKEPAARSGSNSAKVRPVVPTGDEVALTYTVKSGDNLGYIASWYGVGVSDLKDWNGMGGNSLRAGQSLTVYVPKSRSESLQAINSLSFSEKQTMTGKEKSVEPVQDQIIAQAASSASKEQFVLYTVRSGDNLWTIAQKYPGISHEDIMKLNQMRGSKLQTGQVLKIKRKEG